MPVSPRRSSRKKPSNSWRAHAGSRRRATWLRPSATNARYADLVIVGQYEWQAPLETSSIADCPFAVPAVRSARSGGAFRRAIKRNRQGCHRLGWKPRSCQSSPRRLALPAAVAVGRHRGDRQPVGRELRHGCEAAGGAFGKSRNRSRCRYSPRAPALRNTRRSRRWWNSATMICWSWAATRNRGGSNCSSAGPRGRFSRRRRSLFWFRTSEARDVGRGGQCQARDCSLLRACR